MCLVMLSLHKAFMLMLMINQYVINHCEDFKSTDKELNLEGAGDGFIYGGGFNDWSCANFPHSTVHTVKNYYLNYWCRHVVTTGGKVLLTFMPCQLDLTQTEVSTCGFSSNHFLVAASFFTKYSFWYILQVSLHATDPWPCRYAPILKFKKLKLLTSARAGVTVSSHSIALFSINYSDLYLVFIQI